MSNISYICCIEAGILEEQVVRLAESFREFGGILKDKSLVAFRVREGALLSKRIERKLFDLDVPVINKPQFFDYSWLGPINKTQAVLLAENYLQTEQICFLDSDTIILKEPTETLLSKDKQFTACARDKEIGSEGENDPNDKLYQELAKLFSMNIEELPWVNDCLGKKKIRAYWNSGVFTFKQGYNFGRSYYENCKKIIDAKIGKKRPIGFYFTDQLALPFTVLQKKFSIKELPLSHNMPISIQGNISAPNHLLKETSILHYHASQSTRDWEKFMEKIEILPETKQWLSLKGPLKKPETSFIELGKFYFFDTQRKGVKWMMERSIKNNFY